MDIVRVLVTSSGVGSAENIIRALRMQNEIEVEIHAIDINSHATGLYLADYGYIAPPISDDEVYINYLLDICQQNKINVIYPCYSKEIALVSKNADKFDKIGTKMLVPSHGTIETCNNKLKVNALLNQSNINLPKTISNPTSKDLPIFTKFNSGSSSQGAFIIESEDALQYHIKNDENRSRIYQEYIQGLEYTVDVLCDHQSDVVIVCPRTRISTKSGQSVVGETVHNVEINDLCKVICKVLGIVGVCNIQFIQKEEKFYFIEINPRYAAGGLMLTVKAGANLPLASLLMLVDKRKYDRLQLNHRDGLIMIRHYNEIIVEKSNLITE